MPVSRPSCRDEFEVAIICALPLEYDAVSYAFDEFWDQDGDRYRRAPNDPNTYTTGRIGNFNVVLALLSRMGKTNAASTAASIAMSYGGLRMALLVGVCGAAPRNKGEEILLGDVVISSRVIEYDFGRQYSDKFVRKDTLEDSHGRPNKDIRNLLVTLQTDRGLNRLEQRTMSFLQKIQADVSKTKHRGKYGYPGTSEDTLFETTHRHKHHGSPNCACRFCLGHSDPVCEEAINSSCAELGCSNGPIVTRDRLRAKQRAEQYSEVTAQHPTVHIGLVASGDKVMRSAAERDRLSKAEGVIAFDMEGAGIWDELPCIIIKGACDYADSHKNKKWQPFAAATAASAAKALLSCYIKPDRPGANPTLSEDATITDAIHRRNTEQRILSKLWFRKIDNRRETIIDAHRKTFQWALKPPTCDQPWDDLSHWFRAGTGIYWISGKAGSGKSTFMKYISSLVDTKVLLSEWAGDSPCATADFFFWCHGTPEQKTQDGLSRALLYKILSSHPTLIPEALPAMWREAYDGQEEIASPSPAEAEKAFGVISTSPDLGRFCLFIDGLDEYLGNYQDGISFIKRLAAGQNVKVIVSSRPIPDCVAAFRDLPQLDLPDLTRPDIYAYVQDVICEHPDMKRLSEDDPCRSKQIVSDLVDKSSGVFLWVVLACKSLISGLARNDDVIELQARVEDLPPELEDMFQYMLIKVEPRYRAQGSRLLRLCYAEQEAQGWAEVGDNYALALALITDNNLKSSPIQILTKERKITLCKRLEGRLRSHCGGLLEVIKRRACRVHPNLYFCGPEYDDRIDAKVCFIHRTVFEFLKDDKVWELDCLKVEAGNNFDVTTDLSLGRLHLAMQSLHKASPYEVHGQVQAHAVSCLRDGVQWGSKADRNVPQSRDNIFWKMMPFLDALHAPGFTVQNAFLSKLATAHLHDRVDQFSHATLALAADAGAVNYLRQHPCLRRVTDKCELVLDCQPLLFRVINRTSLLGINWVGEGGKGHWPSTPPGLRASLLDAVVRLLLSTGCDPNKFASGGGGMLISSPWARWLQSKYDTLGTTVEEKLAALKTIESFVVAGARARPHVSFNVETWIKELFREPELIETSQSVLQRYRELETDLVVGARRRRADPDELGDRGPGTKRVCPC